MQRVACNGAGKVEASSLICLGCCLIPLLRVQRPTLCLAYPCSVWYGMVCMIWAKKGRVLKIKKKAHALSSSG